MSDLKILNLNKKSDKYLFKKKLSLRRKSKRKLIKETFLMLLLSTFLIYLNYLIPEKKSIFENFFTNIENLIQISSKLISYIYEICLILFMLISSLLILLLFFGAFSRILKIFKRKTRKIHFN